LVAKDTQGVNSIAYPTTFWIEVNTQTDVTNIIIPPTISLDSATVDIGQNITVFGQSAPKQSVIVSLSNSSDNKLLTVNREIVGADGRWTSTFFTTALAKALITWSPKLLTPRLAAVLTVKSFSAASAKQRLKRPVLPRI